MELKVVNIEGKENGKTQLPKNLIVEMPHKQSIFDSIICERASRRQGTHSTLTKGEVRGGGKKPYAQKHTGNARQGSIRNPHFVGGGVAFGPKPNRNYTLKVNKRVSRLALCSAISAKAKTQNIFVLEENTQLKKINTKTIVKFLEILNILNKRILFIVTKQDKNLYLSARNVSRLSAKYDNQASTKDWINCEYVVIANGALNNIAKGIK